MVRLQRFKPAPLFFAIEPLSIPLWCDCNGVGHWCWYGNGATFNPTMVRLQQDFGLHAIVVKLDFQSHYGAIATTSPANEARTPTCFQSHYGAIATCVVIVVQLLFLLPFNPTMVRLQPVIRPTSSAKISSFQSHYGAIATKLNRRRN